MRTREDRLLDGCPAGGRSGGRRFGPAAAEVPPRVPSAKAPTAEEAKKFVDEAEQTLLTLWIDAGRADWVKSTYITDDTEILAAQANEKAIAAAVAFAKQATRFDGLKLPRRRRAS